MNPLNRATIRHKEPELPMYDYSHMNVLGERSKPRRRLNNTSLFLFIIAVLYVLCWLL
jgi:hypothetical protein